jgi:hypothetical protein
VLWYTDVINSLHAVFRPFLQAGAEYVGIRWTKRKSVRFMSDGQKN